jgi:hypothetical protein
MAQGPDWERVQSMVDDFVRTSRERGEGFVTALRREIQRQARALGIATKDDVSRLEDRVRAAEKVGTKASKKAGKKTGKDAAKKGPGKDKAGAKKPSGSS